MRKTLNNKEIVITDRANASRKGIWFDLKIDKVEYSLMNVGELMKTHPLPYEGMFMGWESLRDTKGEQEITRADTLDKLLEELTL